MTDKELDDFFIKTLKAILEQNKEYADSVKDETLPEYEDIKEDYAYIIEDIEHLLKTIKTIDDLAELDEEEINNVYEYLASYTDYFIVDENPAKKAKDMEEYNKLEELLDLFLDDEDFEDEEI